MEYYLKCWPIIEIRRSCLLYPSLVPMYAYRIKNWSCFGFRLGLIRFIINWYSENGCKISSYVGSLRSLATHHLSYWPKICDLSSNFFIKYRTEICRILSISVSTHRALVKYYVRSEMLMENEDIIIVIPGHYRHSYTLEVLEMNNFICLVYHGIYRGIHLLAFSHFSKEKLVIMTISVTASYRHICSLQAIK